MTRFKSTLLVATAVSCALAAPVAFAQAPGPNDGDSSLHGTGATSIQNVLVQEFNCINGNNQLGNSNGTFTTVAEPTDLSTPGGTFSCATQNLNADFSAKYVATGSGFGRQAWRNLTAQFFSSGNSSSHNPWEETSKQTAWSHVQYAFADSSLTDSDLSTYNASGKAYGGAAIMIPKFVLPVAIAYSPRYGTNAAGNALTFNVVGADATRGGLKLSTATYCGIFNGTVKNWNDSAITAANGGTSLQDPNNDTATRWSTDGVPIRLVGRLDNSGTTDIFTRALAAQCGTTGNNFAQNAEALPYATNSGVDFSAQKSDTPYRSTNTSGKFAGTTNRIGREYFDVASGTIKDSRSTADGGNGGNSTASAPSAQPTGNQSSGLFLVANGSGGVAAAIVAAPDYVLNGVTLNGKVGYIGADFINGSPTGNTSLRAARLQRFGGTEYDLPTAEGATNALGTVLPPQSTAKGAYDKTKAGDRTDPLSWYKVLYSSSDASLATPTGGYAITGTTQFIGYTCYKPNNATHIKSFLGWNIDNILTANNDSTGVDRTGIFTDNSNGLLARSNIGALPAPWRRAIRETFLTNSSETSNGTRLGSLNLWIEGAGASSTHCNVSTLSGDSVAGL